MLDYETHDLVGFLIFTFSAIFLLFLVKKYIQLKQRQLQRQLSEPEDEAHQQEDIFNISSRVQGQEQWPTHEAHLSIDHINIMNELNKPPSYQDDAPPSYEEAMRLAAAKQQGESSSVAVIVVAPKPSTTN
ncbi:uncharacterized protein isoform X3 [Leptinotarsa decemlineata]|uniref:uncharacterized protein isoform X3 n=1 Tax=Leptinotarsa decemlineata TaxID=7539 RepID=UPI003D30AD8C